MLLVGSENFTLIGNPILRYCYCPPLTLTNIFDINSKETVRVTATIVEHSRAAKVIVFKKKRRKNYKRKRGMIMIKFMYLVWYYMVTTKLTDQVELTSYGKRNFKNPRSRPYSLL